MNSRNQGFDTKLDANATAMAPRSMKMVEGLPHIC